jgi:hypothetical protein
MCAAKLNGRDTLPAPPFFDRPQQLGIRRERPSGRQSSGWWAAGVDACGELDFRVHSFGDA